MGSVAATRPRQARSRWPDILASALLLLVTVPPITSAPASAATPAAPGPCTAGWQLLPVPDRSFVSVPFDVLASRGRPAWVLGSTNDDRGLLALRWRNGRWVQGATGSRRREGIVGADVAGRRGIVAVGYERTLPDELVALGGRVAAGRWSAARVAGRMGSSATLVDVATLPRGRAVAVGTRLAAGRLRAHAVRSTGRGWQRQDPVRGGAGLLAVERSGRGTAWAVGWRDAGPGVQRPLILRSTPRGWHSVRGADLPAGSAVLTDVGFRSSRDGWAVGYLVRRGTDAHEVILQRWDGRRWMRVALPWSADVSALPRSLSVGADPGEVWITGAQLATDARESRGFVAHLQDGSWRLAVLDVPADLRSEVTDVAATDAGAFAAGTIGATLFLMRTCGEPGTAALAGRRIHVGDVAARRRVADASPEDPDDSPPSSAAGRGSADAVTEVPASTPPVPDARPSGDRPVGPGSTRSDRRMVPARPTGFAVRNVTRSAGVTDWTLTYGGLAADLDGNGWTDLFYGRHGNHPPRILLNGPGGLSIGPSRAFSTYDRHGCDVADVDADGALDVLCAMGRVRGRAIARHELSLRVVAPGRRLARDASGIADPLGRGREVGFLHLDGDPYPEVFITSSPDREDGLPAGNRFYRNVGGRFVPAPGVGLDRPLGGSCLWTGDIDGDGDDDLAYCTQYRSDGRAAGLRVVRNERGVLRDRSAGLGVRAIGDIDVAFADLDRDGHRDLLQLSPTRLRVSRWTRSGYRLVAQVRISDGRAIGVGDASGDGRPDVYVVRGSGLTNRPDLLLVTRRGGRAFTSVRIPQTRKGSADDVVVLDHDRNGLADFLVLNGHAKAGPVQLLASFRVP